MLLGHDPGIRARVHNVHRNQSHPHNDRHSRFDKD
jgi:hypothetical protein